MFLSFTLALLTVNPGYPAAKKKVLGFVTPMKYEGGSPPLNQHDKLETFVRKLPHTTKNLTDLLKAQIAITAQEPLLDLYIGLLNYRPGTVSNGELAALFTALDSANDAAVRLLRRRNKFGQNCNPPNVQIKTQTQGQHHK